MNQIIHILFIMFVRVKTTPNSPRKSVQIVESIRKDDKVKQKIVRYVGIAMNDEELEKLKELADFIKCKIESKHTPSLFSPREISELSRKEKDENKLMVDLKKLKEEQRVIKGIHEVYGKVYDELEFNSVLENPARNKASVNIMKEIVMARIANPHSKRQSVHMLEEDFGIHLNLDSVYGMMDKVSEKVIKKINKTAYTYTKKLFQDKVDVIFFDATTLYFESFTEDEFKQNGYSKDLKFNQPQVLLALMVTKEGLPIGYKAFPGSTYEGHTLIPMLKKIREDYDLDKVVFVADSGMFNADNLKELEDNNFEYIVGARIKNLNKELTGSILDTSGYEDITDDGSGKLKAIRLQYKDDPCKMLIVSHSEKRARKDAYERKKMVDKLMKKINKKVNKKGNDRENKTLNINTFISNHGYKKYLKLDTDKINVEIDKEKMNSDAKWDGLKGIITNSKDMKDTELLNHYRGLWQVEESFRISKHDLKVRPIFHWKPERVKAHIAITFMAFTCVRHLEYRVNLQYKKLSPEVIRQELIHVQGSILKHKETNQRYFLPSKTGVHAQKIYSIMNLKRDSAPYEIE